MSIETTPPSESAPEPDADHIALTGSASIRSMAAGGVTHTSDTPLTLRTQVDPAIFSNWSPPPSQLLPQRAHIINDPPASPPFPAPPQANGFATPTPSAFQVVRGLNAETGSFKLNGEPGNFDLNAKQSSFDTLTARVALLEATLASRPAGVGHNQGPNLDETLNIDEEGIQNLIALLKVQRAAAPVDLAKLIEAARIADPSLNKGQGRVDQFVKGVLTGAGIQVGKEIVKQLEHAAWVQSVYSALQGVFEALMSWMHLL
jgi:hypothetical protein